MAERQDPEIKARMAKIARYVRKRLSEETKVRGAQTRIAKVLGISAPHLTNLTNDPSSLNTRSPGEYVQRAAAKMWNMTYSELEALAMGEGSPPSSAAETDAQKARRLALDIFEFRPTTEKATEIVFKKFEGQIRTMTTWDVLDLIEKEYNRQRQEVALRTPPPEKIAANDEEVASSPKRRRRAKTA